MIYNLELDNQRILERLPNNQTRIKRPRAGNAVAISVAAMRAEMRYSALNYRLACSRDNAGHALIFLNCAKTYRELSK